jgi:hypothetical protein
MKIPSTSDFLVVAAQGFAYLQAGQWSLPSRKGRTALTIFRANNSCLARLKRRQEFYYAQFV